MKGLPAETDFIVIGAGIAGLRAAIELAPAGRVLVLGKKGFAPDPKSGAPPELTDEDELILHLKDTLVAGDGLSRPEAVKTLVDESPGRIEEIIAWGRGPHSHTGRLTFDSEASYSHSHILRATEGSAAGEILQVLQAKARACKSVSVLEYGLATGIQLDASSGHRAAGVSLLTGKGMIEEVACSALLLASGGAGQVYRNTTNTETATGDAIAMASRAGAEVADMEFVQFYPTTLYMKNAPRFQLSEALRSEGGYLRNIEMDRFMHKYHPLAELAPPDVVARAMMHEMEVSRSKDPFVYLDLTHLSAARVQKRFSRIHAMCMEHNLDITEDLIPVRPAAHCTIGGVRTDLAGKTSVDGLYAAGEAASSGVHGANRFPSNSMLEALVFGARAGKAMREEIRHGRVSVQRDKKAASQNGPVDAGIEEVIAQIQQAMWKHTGVVRTRAGMQEAIKLLQSLAPRVEHPGTRRSHEAANLHLVALLVARSALAREESRGVHYRTDHPAHDDRKFLKHSLISQDTVKFT